ncbi:MAG: hypothetical protein ABSB73_11555 [Solirubrobacteraceae bacterium]
MTQIHHVVQSTANRYVVDPDRGIVQRRELVMGASDIQQIKHGDDMFQVGDDGTFQVPERVAAHFLRMPGWHEGPNPFAEAQPEPEPEPEPDPAAKPARSRSKATA